MPTITLIVDARTDEQLHRLSGDEQIPVSEVALRLLRRALRAKRPQTPVDAEAIRAHAAAFAEEDLELAESDQKHRAALLVAEDDAP